MQFNNPGERCLVCPVSVYMDPLVTFDFVVESAAAMFSLQFIFTLTRQSCSRVCRSIWPLTYFVSAAAKTFSYVEACANKVMEEWNFRWSG